MIPPHIEGSPPAPIIPSVTALQINDPPSINLGLPSTPMASKQ